MYKCIIMKFFKFMIRYLLLFIFFLTILSSSFLFDYWAFIIDLIKYHTELFDFIENKFFLSLILFTIIYAVSIAISLPIGTFLTFLEVIFLVFSLWLFFSCYWGYFRSSYFIYNN